MKDGRAAGASPYGRHNAKCDQDGEQKPDPEIDDRLTHNHAPHPRPLSTHQSRSAPKTTRTRMVVTAGYKNQATIHVLKLK